jgi:hypothetical protein
MTKRKKRVLIVLAVMLGVLLLTIGSGLIYFRVRSDESLILLYVAFYDDQPFIRKLFLRQVYEGQPTDEFKTILVETDQDNGKQPRGEIIIPPYTIFGDPGRGFGFTVIAKDGRLVSASGQSCTGDHTFFDALSENEHHAIWAAYRAWYEKWAEKRRRSRKAKSRVYPPKSTTPDVTAQ